MFLLGLVKIKLFISKGTSQDALRQILHLVLRDDKKTILHLERLEDPLFDQFDERLPGGA